MIKHASKVLPNKDSRVIGISLFEEQIVRTFFLSDNFHFLKQLCLKNEVIIFTNDEIGDFLDVKLKEFGIDKTKIIKMKDIRESFLVKLVSFFLRWSDPSTATLRNLYREKNNRNSCTRLADECLRSNRFGQSLGSLGFTVCIS